MFLALGACPPVEAARVLITAELCGLKSEITLVDGLTSSQYVRGRGPALQCKDGETVVFGVNSVCSFLHSLAKDETIVRKGEQSASTGAAVSLPLGFWDIASLAERADAADYASVPEKVLAVFKKYGSGRDGRSGQKILTQAFRDAVTRAFPYCYNAESTHIEVKYDGRKLGGQVVDYCFSQSQQLLNIFKIHPQFDLKTPLEVAQRILSFLDLPNLGWIIKKLDVVGIFINISICPKFLADRTNMMSSLNHKEEHLPAPPTLKSQRVVIDFSSPNIAKEMHVGHLRSTIIGDSLCRFFEHSGHEVLRVNHVGDWGTQFGMLLEYLKDREASTKEDTIQFLNGLSLTELTDVYRQSKKAFDADEDFKTRARKMVVALQSGKDLKARKVWEKLVEVSKRGFDTNYAWLNVSFDNPQGIAGVGYCGESFYQDQIEDTIKQLSKFVTKREEAQLMFTGIPEAKQQKTEEHPEGEIPLILRKSDGGFGYDSTDCAAVRFRIEKLKADRVLYVTDAGQQTHFYMVFEAAKKAGWAKPGQVKLDHVKFGVVLLKGGGKFKTREGETTPLSVLLETAKQRMREILVQRMEADRSTTERFTEERVEQLSKAIGVAAIKYFDLRTNRTKDYEFDADAMCSPDGDTAVYLMYAYARVCSIIDRAQEAGAGSATRGYNPEGASDRERSVAVSLSRFTEVVESSLNALSPHILCGYLYSLSSDLSTFLTDDNERIYAKRAHDSTEALQLEPSRGMQRLFLVRAVRAVLFEGLGLLGIVPYDRM